MGNQPDPSVNPRGPGPAEHLTGNLRWVGPMNMLDIRPTLQQEWEDLLTHQKTWRDVPTAWFPIKGY